MNSLFSQDIISNFSIIAISLSAIFLLVIGVFATRRAALIVTILATIILLITLLIELCSNGMVKFTFNNMLVTDDFGRYVSCLILLGGLITLPQGYLKYKSQLRFEYVILLMLAMTGMLVMVKAIDWISLYVGLELQSLSLYVLAAFARDDRRSTEAAVKYFVLGALASGILLYGISLLYGFAGTTNLLELANNIYDHKVPVLAVNIAAALVMIGMLFKVSAVPFHMWLPDVYEGAPTIVVAFFASVAKIAAIAVFLRVVALVFGQSFGQWQYFILILAVLSIALGAFAAIGQNNFKRLLAYSSIGHIGYMLLAVSSGSMGGWQSVTIYMFIYLLTMMGIFSCLIFIRSGKSEMITDLAGLAQNQPCLAFAMGLFMFSLAGVPPAAGFLAKFYILEAAMASRLYLAAVLAVILSVVSAYYYLRVVKIMYFDAAADKNDTDITGNLQKPPVLGNAIIAFCTFAMIAVFIMPAPLLEMTKKAVYILF